jgi:hypothetical protein
MCTIKNTQCVSDFFTHNINHGGSSPSSSPADCQLLGTYRGWTCYYKRRLNHKGRFIYKFESHRCYFSRSSRSWRCDTHAGLIWLSCKHSPFPYFNEIQTTSEIICSNKLQVHITLDPSNVNTTTATSSLSDEETVELMIANSSKLLDAGITVPGGHAHAMGGVAQGVEGVRDEVRKRAAEGADLIKAMSSGGFMTAENHPSEGRYTVEELEAVKDEATKFGMPITTHATGTQWIERAVDAKLHSIEHWHIALGLGVSSFSGISSVLTSNIHFRTKHSI